MAPDLNSISSQPSGPATTPTMSQPRSIATAMNPSSTHREGSISPRPSVHSLAAAATMNATERRNSSTRASPRLDRQSSDRRRSQVALNISLNDPSLPSPGELSSADQRRRSSITTGGHHRQPSLGDIHNELEQEQEAQVNRMLSMIRQQQNQLDTLRTQQANSSSNIPNSAGAIEDSTPASERSFSFPSVHPAVPVGAAPLPSRPHIPSRENSTSNTALQTRSPALRPLPSSDLHSSSSHEYWLPSPADSRNSSSRRNSLRDEGAYYQAEHANLQRENQMLKVRIRELEKQLVEKQGAAQGQIAGNIPIQRSALATSTSEAAE